MMEYQKRERRVHNDFPGSVSNGETTNRDSLDDPSTLFCVSHRLHGLGEPLRVRENVVPLTNRGWIIRDLTTRLSLFVGWPRKTSVATHSSFSTTKIRFNSPSTGDAPDRETLDESLIHQRYVFIVAALEWMRNRRRVDGRLSVFRSVLICHARRLIDEMLSLGYCHDLEVVTLFGRDSRRHLRSMLISVHRSLLRVLD